MESLQLNENEQQMFDDLRWAMRSPEVQQHAGMLVAVFKKRVVGVGANRDALVAQAAETAQCRCQDIVVLTVPGTDFAETPR
jgi:hypothetical protein